MVFPSLALATLAPAPASWTWVAAVQWIAFFLGIAGLILFIASGIQWLRKKDSKERTSLQHLFKISLGIIILAAILIAIMQYVGVHVLDIPYY